MCLYNGITLLYSENSALQIKYSVKLKNKTKKFYGKILFSFQNQFKIF